LNEIGVFPVAENLAIFLSPSTAGSADTGYFGTVFYVSFAKLFVIRAMPLQFS
jgi:hypothetical protein